MPLGLEYDIRHRNEHDGARRASRIFGILLGKGGGVIGSLIETSGGYTPVLLGCSLKEIGIPSPNTTIYRNPTIGYCSTYLREFLKLLGR